MDSIHIILFLVISLYASRAHGDGECDDSHCNDHGSCHQYHCTCYSDYYGRHCEWECTDDTYCHDHGTASHGHSLISFHTSTRTCECSCHSGYHGSRCEIDCTEHGYCHGHGTPQYDAGKCSCTCDSKFYGSRCDTDVDPCLGYNCNNHGNCILGVNGGRTCSCQSGFEGDECQHASTTIAPSTTTPTTTTTTTTTETTTTTTQYPYRICSKSSVMIDIAYNATIEHHSAPACKSGTHRSTEALVLRHCNVNVLISTWTQGRKITDICLDIPAYTPIASFVHGLYPVGQGLTGIFVKCLPEGFQMIVQSCTQEPETILVVKGGVNLMDPDFYYTLQ